MKTLTQLWPEDLDQMVGSILHIELDGVQGESEEKTRRERRVENTMKGSKVNGSNRPLFPCAEKWQEHCSFPTYSVIGPVSTHAGAMRDVAQSVAIRPWEFLMGQFRPHSRCAPRQLRNLRKPQKAQRSLACGRQSATAKHRLRSCALV